MVPASAEEPSAPSAPMVVESTDGDGVALLARAHADASAAARASGRRVQVDELTSETTEVWALPEGGFEATLSAGPVRVRRDGGWVPMDLTLVKDPVDGSIRTVADPYDTRFAGAQLAGSHVLAAFGKGDDRLSVGWDGALPEPVLQANKATYVDARPGVDLVVEATGTGLETFLVVKSPAAVNQVREVVFPVTGKNAASFERDPHGNAKIVNGSGRAVAEVPAPEMWDAARTPANQPARKSVVSSRASAVAQRARSQQAEPGLELRMTPDVAWMTDAATSWPVVIDPTINALTNSYDIYVMENDTTHNGGNSDMHFGHISTGTARAFIRWDSTVLVGASITSASLQLFNYYSGTCSPRSWQVWTTGSIPNGVLWDNQPLWVTNQSSSTATTGYDTSCGDGWVSVDALNFFQAAATAGDASADMGIRAGNETDSSYWKQVRANHADYLSFAPKATVTYNSYPTVGSRSTIPATACATGSGRPVINTVTPQLSAVISDVDAGASVKAEFEWWAVGGGAKIGSAVTGAAASGTAFSTTVPSGAFTEGGIYQWRVRGNDGTLNGNWSAYCEFQVMVLPPPVPGCASGVAGDFNGDGVRDVLIADPMATVNGDAEAGSVRIVNGADGATRAITEDDTEVIGDSEPGDRFGQTFAIYDANRDGCADVAVGVPFEDIGSIIDAGQVHLLFGSPSGLNKSASAPAILYEQGTNGVPGTKAANDNFGFSLAAGQTSTAEPFLVVGAPGDDVNGNNDAGVVHYFRGSVKVAFDQASGGGNVAEPDDRFGYALAATPYHIAASAPGEGKDVSTQFAGQVDVYSHTLTSGVPTKAGLVNQDSSGVSDAMEAGDTFGKSIAMAPFWPAGDSLLVVGVPGEDAVPGTDAGMIHEFRMSGTTVTQIASLNQETSGISGASEAGDLFGEKVLVVNTDPGVAPTAATLQVAVGVPGEDLGTVLDAGSIRVFAGGVGTITSDVVVERAATANLPGTPGVRELVGLSMGASATELYVSSPYANRAVWALPWSSLAVGTVAVSATWAPGAGGIPAGAVTFGTQVG
ncbi:hypothetical protein GCM10009662_39660 [Catellatospora coxensis]|uniref:FG-GAP repeat protein n=1 Tax=Catellatospora coxensis TaxID=310354 RepID=A0A8J3KWL8_9ACTN|nr:hypothetical protein Cco03nite_32990 [Catellatospora coxensis]